jgi:predicted nucleic acid-binding protein
VDPAVSARTFVDSNVFIYAFDSLEPAKQERALRLIEARTDWVVSPQVMMEFYSVVTTKARVHLSADDAETAISSITAGMDLVAPDRALVLDAIALARRDRLSIWDALIGQSAIVGRCSRLFTEDLQDGRTFGDLRVENPFADLR